MTFVSEETGKKAGQAGKSGQSSDPRKSAFTENIFVATAKDALKVVDAYGLKSSSPINFLENFKKQFDSIVQ